MSESMEISLNPFGGKELFSSVFQSVSVIMRKKFIFDNNLVKTYNTFVGLLYG